MRLGWLAIVDFPNSLEAVLLQVGSISKIANDPSQRVAKVDTCSNYGVAKLVPAHRIF
jgi:hypothetical protein